MIRHSAIAFLLATLLLAGIAVPAQARVLLVGPQRAIQLPSQAAAIARDGDRIVIDPGIYRDCAVWRASNLVIEGRAPGVTMSGRVCFERGIFIFTGNNTTVRGIAFAGARGLWHTAAGILQKGNNLLVENSRFEDNENGILAGGGPASQVRVVNSRFRGNGSCLGACAHGIYAGGPIASLEVERCHFLDTRTAHHIKSRARTTIVRDNDIADGDSGTSSYLIDIPNGGNTLIQHNTLRKGPNSANPEVAITIGEEGVKNDTSSIVVRDNSFASALPTPTVFVRNNTATPATLSGNRLEGQVTPLRGPGSVQ